MHGWGHTCFCSQHLLFAPGSSEVTNGFFVSVAFGLAFAPTVYAHFFFLSQFIVSLCFVAGGEVCPGVSIAALQQKVPGLRPVSKSVFFITDLLFCRAKTFLS